MLGLCRFILGLLLFSSFTAAVQVHASDPFEEVLVVYNAASEESTELVQFYKNQRPGAVYAQYLGLETSLDEAISQDEFEKTLKKPIEAWLDGHNQLTIRFIVLVRGIPSRVRQDRLDRWTEGAGRKIKDFWDASWFARLNTDTGNVFSPYSGSFTVGSLNAESLDVPLLKPAPELKRIHAALPSVQYQLSKVSNCAPGAGGREYVLESEQVLEIPEQLKIYFVGFHAFHQRPSVSQIENAKGFAPILYPGTRALISHMDMGSLEATQAYILKIKRAYSKMRVPSSIVSGNDARISGSQFYFDERSADPQLKRTSQLGLYMKSFFHSFNVEVSSEPLKQASHVSGFFTQGVHGQRPASYAVDGSIVFKGHSSWAVVASLESFNGKRKSSNTGQSSFEDWFSKTAFGSKNYEFTPIGAVTHVDEPLIWGVQDPAFFYLWDRGLTFVESAWLSRRTQYFMAVGDPLVTR